MRLVRGARRSVRRRKSRLRRRAFRGHGAKAAANPWEGAEGLEWTVPSPAPHHTFVTPPNLETSH